MVTTTITMNGERRGKYNIQNFSVKDLNNSSEFTIHNSQFIIHNSQFII